MKKLFIFFTLFFCLPVFAQTYDGLTIPTTHPRLFWNAERISQAQTWLAANPYTPGTCDEDDTGYCVDIAFQHLMTAGGGSPVDCSSTITFILAVASNGPAYYGPRADAERGFGEWPLLVYDWCYDQMTPTQRSAFISNWQANWINGQQDNCSGGYQNNYCWGYLRNNFEWGVVSYWENTSNAQAALDGFFAVWTPGLVTNLSSTTGGTGGAGGVTQEGNNYGRYMADYSKVPLITSSLLGNDLILSTTFWKAFPFAVIYSTTPSSTYTSNYTGTTQFELFPWDEGVTGQESDYLAVAPETGGGGAWYVSLMSVMAQYYSSVNVGKYASEWESTVTPKASPKWVMAVDTSTPISYSTLPLDYYAPGSGFFWGRKAWDTSSTVVHFQLNSPSQVLHVEANPGTWQMWQGGRWLSRQDTGYSDTFVGYNSTGTILNENSGALNGLLVNPDLQGCSLDPVGCQGDGGETLSGALVVAAANRLESQSGYAYASVDISGTYYASNGGSAYPNRDNPAVNTVVREFVWVRDLSTLVIFDRILTNSVGGVAAANMRRTFLAHCEENWNLTTANTANCQPGNSQELFLTTLLPDTPSPAYHVTAEGGPMGTYRLEINNEPGTAQSYFAHVLQGGTTSTSPLTPTISLSGSTYTITLDANHSINFNQGATSSGGSITLYGTTTNFTSSVESITVTDSGPVWGGSGGSTPAAITPSFTPAGGRDISANAGEDRTELWGEGLQILKAHPLFGVGLGNMRDYTEEYLTAHNSLVVCAAELGLFGLYFWSMFLFSTARAALVTASPWKVSDGKPIVAEAGLFPQATRKIEAVDKAEINHLGRLLVLSLTGFLVAGWFLSRAFVMTFFLLGGMAEVAYEMALRRGMIAPRLPLERVWPYAGRFAIVLILLMYIMLRTAHLMH